MNVGLARVDARLAHLEARLTRVGVGLAHMNLRPTRMNARQARAGCQTIRLGSRLPCRCKAHEIVRARIRELQIRAPTYECLRAPNVIRERVHRECASLRTR